MRGIVAKYAKSTERGVGTKTPDVDRVALAVGQILELKRNSSLQHAVRVGEVIFVEIFSSSLDEVRKKGPKSESFGRLAKHPQVPYSLPTLWRFVSIYELTRRFPGLLTTKTLGVAHLRAVLGLPHDKQEMLLKAAEHERLSAAELEDRARRYRTETPARGRRPMPVALRSAQVLRALSAKKQLPHDISELAALPRQDKLALLEAIREIKPWLERVEESLRKRMSGSDSRTTPN